MDELNVYLIRFLNNGLLMKSIVLAETFQEAEKLLIKDYAEYGIEIQIEEYEEVTTKGVALTWNQPFDERKV
jgi:hypothetical protein